MKRYFYIIFLLFIFINNNVYSRYPQSIGLGIALGDPTGPVFKYWLSKRNAIDLGIGFQKNITIYGGYLWHNWKLFKDIKKGVLGGYLGAGTRFQEKENENKIGIRSVFGLDYWFERNPIELYFEIAPIFQIHPDTDTEFDILLGVRFYFNK